jgi:hypothetical protein
VSGDGPTPDASSSAQAAACKAATDSTESFFSNSLARVAADGGAEEVVVGDDGNGGAEEAVVGDDGGARTVASKRTWSATTEGPGR